MVPVAILFAAAACATSPSARPTSAIVVAAAGDLDLSGDGDPLDGVAAVLLPGTVRIVNLESPLTTHGKTTSDGAIRLAASPARARLVAGRVDVVSLANNHALDWGEAGREDTRRALAAVGVRAAADGETVELAGARPVRVVARFLAPGTDLARAGDGLVTHVEKARAGGAIVVVSLHWGRTGMLLPSEEQRQLAARLVDAGATAILGHGPHTIQGVERRGRAIVAYSLGNLAFGCPCTDVGDAYALSFSVENDGSAGAVVMRPFRAGLAGGPVRLDADDGLYELVASLSNDLGTTLVRDGAVLRERR
jgi:poly-gamma-glutamate synthesis protein (capsule biosynthesis protein)